MNHLPLPKWAFGLIVGQSVVICGLLVVLLVGHLPGTRSPADIERQTYESQHARDLAFIREQRELAMREFPEAGITRDMPEDEAFRRKQSAQFGRAGSALQQGTQMMQQWGPQLGPQGSQWQRSNGPQ